VTDMRIGALVPVRLASERLPGKALLPLAGRPVITHLLDRLFASRYLSPSNVIVCMTTEQTDDPLVPVVESTGARVFRGSRDDIIDRFYQAVRSFGFDVVIQADGDDPCADTLYMDLCVEQLLADETLGIVMAEGLPLGLASNAFRAAALETVWRHHVTEQNDTGFMFYFTRTGLCKTSSVKPITPGHQHESARLTLDYPEDLTFFGVLFDLLSDQGEPFGVEQIVSLLRMRPELLEINAGFNERFWQRTRELMRLEFEIDGVIKRLEM
jgi:spore coat polysaccharide biosynthesis protein SpsF